MNYRSGLPICIGWILTVLALAACGSPERAEVTAEDPLPDTQMPPTEPVPLPSDTAAPSPTVLPSATPTEPAPAYQTYTIGENLGYSLWATDLNGDSYPDIMAGDMGRDVILLLFNQGDGTFQEAVEIATGEGPRFVIGADLDGDSHTDLVVPHSPEDKPGKLSILLNDGNDTFQPQVEYDTIDNWWAFPVDLDGDSDLDLVIDDATAKEHQGGVFGVRVFLNNGDATFLEGESYFTELPNFASVYVADLNSDAIPDMAVRHYPDPTISILFGIGDGSFGEPVTVEATDRMHGFIAADLNGDPYPDLAWVNGFGLTSVLINNGDGTFQEKADYDVGGETFIIEVADVDGDTALDIVIGPTGSGMASLLTNNGDGTFEITKDYYFKDAWASLFVLSDVDGDGTPELVGWDENSVYVFPLDEGD